MIIPIILAAGKSSRFYPYGAITSHKSMIFLAGKPILQYTLESLKKSGFNEVVIVVNLKDQKIRKYFGNGQNLGIKINYAIQPEPKGMGNALLCAKDFIKQDFLLLNANQINIEEIIDKLLSFKKQQKCIGVIVGKKQKAQEKYGAFKLEGERILEIIEKPGSEQNIESSQNLRVVGIYLLNKNFIEFLEQVPDNENSFEDGLNSYFLKNEVKVLILDKKTYSLKYPWDIFEVKDFILNNLQNYISKKAQIKKGVIIEGKVFINEGAIIYENAVIKGPCYIGKNTIVGAFAHLRGGCILEESVIVGSGAEVKNAVFMKNSSMHSGFVGDSIIGENSKIGAGFISANKRFDNQNIKVEIKGVKIDSFLNRLGVFIGSNVNIGVQSSTMPGVIIGDNSVIYPGQKIFKNIAPKSIIKP